MRRCKLLPVVEKHGGEVMHFESSLVPKCSRMPWRWRWRGGLAAKAKGVLGKWQGRAAQSSK
ncbi:hypothetical protein E2562_032539 [Oryza meyeriana var. granulata]|uniref:Uncharacterized protein n=1 Tax=Oryza meyeriana var. granulata TaxID=110450 RepID=A0A6G1CVI9_9ORYZ|nr:hypothetical protein E2562_032539 [Oryza meyeriana var. granulata]